MTTTLDALLEEASPERALQICNACRYCEGFCPVFPAMTRHLEFPPPVLEDLAHLCHSCGACLHACPYAPPHAFGLNLPRALARVRRDSWAQHAWPAPLARLYGRQGLAVAGAVALAFALLVAWLLARHGMQGSTLWGAVPGGDFYRLLPHGAMVSLFAPVFGFALLSLAIGARRFWRANPPGPVTAPALAEAVHDALRLRHLGGGQEQGCHEADDAFTLARRRAHHLTVAGFALCFAATSVATLMHYGAGRVAPYDWASLPKLLGVPGGVLLAVGSAWLGLLRHRRHPDHVVHEHQAMDLGFIALLFGTATSGLALALLRGTPALPLALAVHLGLVLALFALLPFGKAAHAVYRSVALLKWAVTRRQPSPLELAGDA